MEFERKLHAYTQYSPKPVNWVDWSGNSVGDSTGVTVSEITREEIDQIFHGDKLGDPARLRFRDPASFRAGEVHNYYHQWHNIVDDPPSPQQVQVLKWINDKVSIFEYFQPFSGSFKGKQYCSDRPPSEQFRNNMSCKPFVNFVRSTLLDRLTTGAISLKGKVGEVEPPHLVLPLTVEPTKPRLCHDARFLNLWMRDMPFKLDTLLNLPRYVSRDTYQTILDDKSGYDHLLLTEESRTFFGIQWGGWYFVYNTLPFGWKISPFVYHSTGLVVSNFFRSMGIPCSLYIDDRHNGQLQIQPNQGAYANFTNLDEHNFAAAKSAVFLVAYFLISLGYFLGLSKSILMPRKIVPYLGFLSDSTREVFLLIPAKKEKFLSLIERTLACSMVSVKSLQRLVGKCVSFSLVVPGALLYTREMNSAISRGLRTSKPIKLHGALKEEVSQWLFLRSWDDPLPWRDERHIRISLATDASASGWGGSVTLSDRAVQVSDYWLEEEQGFDISVKEALALDKVLLSFSDSLKNAWVDGFVDNLAVVHSWQRQGGRSMSLNKAIKKLFLTTTKYNIALHLMYVPSNENEADAPSRRLTTLDSKLHPELWEKIQQEFGGPKGHTCDLMALDSNAMTDQDGSPLPHFTPRPSPQSSGVNLFAQDLSSGAPFLDYPYVFPPLSLMGSVLRFLKFHRRSCTIITLDVYPKKYWWPLVRNNARKSRKLAVKGKVGALLSPSKQGWIPHPGIPGDLWAFSVHF